MFGGALALAAGLTYRKQLSGILSHSGWVCLPTSELVNLAGSANATVPIMLISGLEDEMVVAAAAQTSARALRTARRGNARGGRFLRARNSTAAVAMARPRRCSCKRASNLL